MQKTLYNITYIYTCSIAILTNIIVAIAASSNVDIRASQVKMQKDYMQPWIKGHCKIPEEDPPIMEPVKGLWKGQP